MSTGIMAAVVLNDAGGDGDGAGMTFFIRDPIVGRPTFYASRTVCERGYARAVNNADGAGNRAIRSTALAQPSPGSPGGWAWAAALTSSSWTRLNQKEEDIIVPSASSVYHTLTPQLCTQSSK